MRVLLLIDGENIVARYEEMLKAGSVAQPGVVHEPGTFLWHPSLLVTEGWVPLRVSYYTTVVGDDQEVERVKKMIQDTRYSYRAYDRGGWGNLVPCVFKKPKRQEKTSVVDINITVDAMRHTYNDSIDGLVLVSGDGDYVPLVQEVMRQGKVAQVAAFSKGLSPALRLVSDGFMDLDARVFVSEEAPAQPTSE